MSSPHKIVLFQIGNSDSRWTVFYDKSGLPTYNTFTDKAKEGVKRLEKEFTITKKQWTQLTDEESRELYKTTYKGNANRFGMTVVSTPC